MVAVGDPRGYYRVLGIERTASAGDIRAAFRRRAKDLHPDGAADGGDREAFRERRKMLHNVLTRQLPVTPDRVDAALDAVGIARDRRPQTVAVGEWLALAEALGDIPVAR